MKELFLIPSCFSGVSYLNQGHLQAEVVTLFCRQAAVVAHKQYTVAAGTVLMPIQVKKRKRIFERSNTMGGS